MNETRWLRPGRTLGSHLLRVAALSASAGTASTLRALADSRPAQAPQIPYLIFQNQIRPKPSGKTVSANPTQSARMLVQADEIRYDEQQSAGIRGRQCSDRLQRRHVGPTTSSMTRRTSGYAAGDGRLTAPEGKVTYGQQFDLSDDFRDGFIDSLRPETADQIRLAADRGDRTDKNYAMFHFVVYTPCESCRDNLKRQWQRQVKTARVTHKEAEKVIYSQDANI